MSCFGASRPGAGGCFLVAVREAPDNVEVHRNDENAQQRGAKHPADDDGPECFARNPTRAGGEPQRKAAENKGEGGHQNGPQTDARAGQGGLDEGFAALDFGLGKFDDQNGVLGRKTDEHDQADLDIDVVLKPARPQR